MTEDEMKTKECPNKFLSATLCVALTDEDRRMTKEDLLGILDSVKCIGSDCAMWQWNEGGEWITPDGSKLPDEAITPEEHDATWVKKGYCGLIK